MATAWDGEQLVGFAYGHALNAQTHWWDNFLTPVASEITRKWDGRTFAVIDMAVARSRGSASVGSSLTRCVGVGPRSANKRRVCQIECLFGGGSGLGGPAELQMAETQIADQDRPIVEVGVSVSGTPFGRSQMVRR